MTTTTEPITPPYPFREPRNQMEHLLMKWRELERIERMRFIKTKASSEAHYHRGKADTYGACAKELAKACHEASCDKQPGP